MSDATKILPVTSTERRAAEFKPTFQTGMSISAWAMLSISERGEAKELFDGENVVELSVGIEEDEPEGTISFAFYTNNATNEENGRAFHISSNVGLSWAQVEHLHRFLGYLMETNSVNKNRRLQDNDRRDQDRSDDKG